MIPDIDPKYYWRNEYTAVKNHIAENLWKHDNCTSNNSASESRQTGFSLGNWKRWIIEDRVFYFNKEDYEPFMDLTQPKITEGIILDDKIFRSPLN